MRALGAAGGAGQNAKLTLQHFMLQSQFVSAYRQAIRSTRPLPDPHTRRETVDHFRSEIERLRFTTDIDVLKTQLSAFQKTVKTLGGTFGIGGLAPETGARLVGRSSS